jgi:hypothetical protein
MYLWEDNGFASSPTDSNHKPFGTDATVGATEGSNALRRVFRPGKRAAIQQLAMVFDGAFSVQFTMTNPWWFRTLMGAPSMTDNGDGTFTYEYSFSVDGSPDTIRIIEGHEQSGKERVLKGCMVTRVTIDTSVEEEAQVSLEGAYADEEILEPASLTAQPETQYDPMTFAEGSVSVGGAVEAYVQSMGLSIENQIDPIREMGTRFAIDYNPKVIQPTVDFSKIFHGEHDSLEKMYGGTGNTSPQENADDNEAAVDMDFDNGVSAGSGQNKGTFGISGTLIDSYDESGIGDPQADLEENINRSGLEPSLTWTNEQSEAA